MAALNRALLAFNRGRVSRLALARVDLKRMALSADISTNWMPRTLGSMMLRPGLGFIGSTRSNLESVFIPFIFSKDDTALLEITDSNMRVWLDDELLTRGSVSTAVSNDTFDTDLASWTDNDESGAASVWVTGGYMGLTGDGTNAAIRDQEVTVGASDQNDEHALRIVIQRGPVVLRVGSSQGADDYIAETELQTGVHSLAFTPTGNFFIRFQSRLKRQVLVDSCEVEGSGVVAVAAPWAEDDLSLMRWDQSGDVIFVACDGYQQRRIERRSTRSWSVVKYYGDKGPFLAENVGPITMTASAISGNITLTASAAYFKSTHVGALFRVSHIGQTRTAVLDADSEATDPILLTNEDFGVDRVFTVEITGTWTGTLKLQVSTDGPAGPYTDSGVTYTGNIVESRQSNQDGLNEWWRVAFDATGHGSGSATVSISKANTVTDGMVRITAFTSSTQVSAEVIHELAKVTATSDWAEGAWSDYQGWPTAVTFYEGRLWWAGQNSIWGSVSDAFDLFDEEFEGDAGPINRTIGSGPVEDIYWLLPLQRLIAGAGGAEFSCRSTSFDEPLTPTNFNIKAASGQGSVPIAGVKLDARGVFVQAGGTRVYELAFDAETYDYGSNDLTAIVPEIAEPGVRKIVIQRQPDTRIHVIKTDGTVAIMVFDTAEKVACWLDFETDGDVEDAVVLPGDIEDQVYYIVNRTIDGSTVRYLEKWAMESECRGEDLNKQADSYITYTGAASTTISGLDHLVGEEVIVWADGVDFSDGVGADQTTYTVNASGEITLPSAQTNVVVGLPYRARFKSTKLAYAAETGSNLGELKNVSQVGLILADAHHKGLRYGRDFDNMNDLAQVKGGKVVPDDTVHTDYDEGLVAFPGSWSPDSRVCLEANAPRPCTVLAAIISGGSHGKS